MRKLVGKLGFLLILVGAGAVAYRVLLTDEARKSLKDSYSSIKEAYGRVSELVGDVRGIEQTEDELPNQAATRLQWEALGF